MTIENLIALAVQRLALEGNREGSTRLVLHELVDKATRQWAPVRQGTLVVSLGRVYHISCAKEPVNPRADQEAYMDLVDTDRESPIWRCRCCGEEVSVFLNFVAASELTPC
jgi:hypothetical protein